MNSRDAVIFSEGDIPLYKGILFLGTQKLSFPLFEGYGDCVHIIWRLLFRLFLFCPLFEGYFHYLELMSPLFGGFTV